MPGQIGRMLPLEIPPEPDRKLLSQNLDRNHHPANAYHLYNKRSGHADKEFTEHCNESMDSLLVFSGLFSAVTVALIVESYKDLRDEPTARTEQLLEALLRKNANVVVNPPPLPQFSPTVLTVATNVLLFLSLAFSLFASLGALLVKQWAREVFRGLDAIGSSQFRAREHFQRVEGVQHGRFPEIIDTIPMILHFSLFLFFAGLLCWLYNVNYIIHNILLATTISGFLLYIVMAVIPVYRPKAPYKWPVSTAFIWASRLLNSTHLIIGKDQGVPSKPISKPIICTPLARIENSVDLFTSTPNEVDYKLLTQLMKEADTVTELEAVIDCLRNGLALTPGEPSILNNQQLSLLVDRAIDIAASCRCFRDGHFDIHAGTSLERATMVIQLFDLILQITPIQAKFDENRLLLVSEIADLLLDRAMEAMSLDEIALHASVVAQIGRRLGKFDHLDKALRVILRLRDLGPIPRDESEQKEDHPWLVLSHRMWTMVDRETHQRTISGYLYSLTLLVIACYVQENEADEQLLELQEATYVMAKMLRFPALSRRTDNFLLLQEVMKIEWVNNTGCNEIVAGWMKRVMLGAGLKLNRLPDGTHVLEMPDPPPAQM